MTEKSNLKQGTHFRKSNFKHKVERLQIPQKLLYEKFYVHETILRTRNCRRKFIKKLKIQRKYVN